MHLSLDFYASAQPRSTANLVLRLARCPAPHWPLGLQSLPIPPPYSAKQSLTFLRRNSAEKLRRNKQQQKDSRKCKGGRTEVSHGDFTLSIAVASAGSGWEAGRAPLLRHSVFQTPVCKAGFSGCLFSSQLLGPTPTASVHVCTQGHGTPSLYFPGGPLLPGCSQRTCHCPL